MGVHADANKAAPIVQKSFMFVGQVAPGNIQARALGYDTGQTSMRLLAALLFAVVVPAAQAQYPQRAVHVVVPFPAGGPAHILTRVLAQKLSARWSQAVVIDNKPGAGGAIGSEFVARST